MRAVYIEEFGGPEVLKFGELPTPKPGPREVLVRVKAVSVNHLDIWVRRGVYRDLPFPHVLGSDIAGIVEEVGPGVRNVRVGDRVVVNPGTSCGVCENCLRGMDNLCKDYKILGEHVWGGYAEYVKVPDANILPYPEGLKWEEAAAVPLTFLTAWHAVVTKGKIEQGEKVLVMSGGGGVGSAAVQIAKLFNAYVITTVGSDWKVERAYALGADLVVNWRKEDLERAIREKVGRVDLVIDHTGQQHLQRLINLTRWGGRVVIYGATSGYKAQVDLRHIFYRQVSLIGSTMGSKGEMFRILKLVEDRKLKPVIYRVLPLKQAQEAHRLLEGFSPFGKVVMTVG